MTDDELLKKHGYKPTTYFTHTTGWYLKDGKTYDRRAALDRIVTLLVGQLDRVTRSCLTWDDLDRDTRIHDPMIDLGGEG